MKFIDLDTQYRRIKPKLLERIEELLDSGKYIMGPQVAELESTLANYTNRKYCISVSSGTDALLIPLMAYGIGRGDAVFVPSFTFFASAEVISFLGATPIFIEVEEDTFNIDINHLIKEIERVKSEGKLTPRMIIPVGLFGLIPDFVQINEIAKKYNLLIMEDAAQSFGAEYNGIKSCKFGDVSATSFYPAKPLGAYGDGGAIFTDDAHLANIIKSIRVHGQGEDNYNNVRIGLNGRLDTIQALVLIEKMKMLDEELIARDRVANLYNQYLKSVKTPKIANNYKSAWAQYSVLAENGEQRTAIMKKLNENNIPSVIYYPKPLHLQDAFKDLHYKNGDLPITESISERVFSLPMHPYLEEKDIKDISELINY